MNLSVTNLLPETDNKWKTRLNFKDMFDCPEDEISDPSILGLLHRKTLKAKSLEDFLQIVDLMIEQVEIYQPNRPKAQTTAKYSCLVGMMSAIFSTFVKLFFSAEIKLSLL